MYRRTPRRGGACERALFFLLIVAVAGCSGPSAYRYPASEEGDTEDVYFGTTVKDPYRWLEEMDSPQVQRWIKAQNALSTRRLAKRSLKKKVERRLRELWDYERWSTPFKGGGRYYFYKNTGLQNHSVLYRLDDLSKPEEASVFLDPNTFSEDGSVSLAGVHFSRGKYAAVLLSESGSDWRVARVLRVDDASFLSEELKNIKFTGIAWVRDEGFYYTAYGVGQGDLFAKVEKPTLYYHKIGSAQEKDQAVFSGDDAGTGIHYMSASISDDYRYLFVYASRQTKGNALFVRDLSTRGAPWRTVVGDYRDDHSVVATEGSTFFMLTSRDAPKKRLIRTTYSRPSQWTDVIPEGPHALSVTAGGGHLFAHYMVDVADTVTAYRYTGEKVCEVPLPGKGSLRGFSGKKDEKTLFYTYETLSTPPTVYALRVADCTSEVFHAAKFPARTGRFITRQVFYTSKDGTKIPMYIAHRRDLDLLEGGPYPTYLYGYGGFNISLKARFRVGNFLWMENSGIYAQPNLRGGGEYGEAWHKQGIKQQKQNVFDDFIAAAEYLVEGGYTSPEKLVIAGGSNGGLLVGACLTQRPDLYGAALPDVGVLDMLRYHTFTVGSAWAYDYGTAEESKESFENLLRYSPVHNARPNRYPAVLITTADHDDRVVPAHSYKFAAALQKNQQGEAPIFIRIYTSTGHGRGKTMDMRIKEYADRYAFVMERLGVSWKEQP